MQEFNSYKINEVLEHKYYQIPQELFDNPLHKDNLNSDSKILYAFLLDRLTLSQKYHWVNEIGEVYLIFTRTEVQEKLSLSDKTVTKAFKQLIEANLINEKIQGLGKPNLIYVGKIRHEQLTLETENIRPLNRKIYDSGVGENTIQDTENLRAINTNIINTNLTNTDSINLQSNFNFVTLEQVKEKCCLNEFAEKDKVILEDVIDTLYHSPTLKVGQVIVNNAKILSKIELITKSNLQQLLDILENTSNIKNTTNYLMICLYNNLGNINITTYKSKNKIENKHYGRKYPEGFFDQFYANVPKEDLQLEL